MNYEIENGKGGLMNKPDRKQVKKIIQNLIKRRQEHEDRINKLLNPNFQMQDVTKCSAKQQDYSQVLKRLEGDADNEDKHHLDSVGGLGNHVNLLATVSLKTQCHLASKAQVRQQGKLSQSLSKHYPNHKFTCRFNQQLIHQSAQWMKQLIAYLIQFQMNEGLFVQIKGIKQGRFDYYGTRFQIGKFQEIHLSLNELDEQEKKLVYQETRKEQVFVNISLLLLKRLINISNQSTFPEALFKLFSFPFKQFNIRKSLQLLSLIDTLQKLQQQHEQIKSIKVYGQYNKDGSTDMIKNLNKQNKIQKYRPLINKYSTTFLIDETELPVKQIPLSCLINHFVVITLNVKNYGGYYISAGSSHSQMENSQYRVFILDSERRVVKAQIINNRQFIYCLLNEQDYQVYISPIYQYNQQTNIDSQSSFELVQQNQISFTMWVQGKYVYSKEGDLGLDLRLKQQYNNYTFQIASRYLQSHIQSQQFNCQPSDIIITRTIINSLNLVTDTLHTGSNWKQNTKFIINYSGKHCLCDQYFQQTSVMVTNQQLIVLYEPVSIDSIIVEGKKDNQDVAVQFKMVTQFV